MRVTLHFPKDLTFSDEELFAFCQVNPDLRIERDSTGFLIIIPPPALNPAFATAICSPASTIGITKPSLGASPNQTAATRCPTRR